MTCTGRHHTTLSGEREEGGTLAVFQSTEVGGVGGQTGAGGGGQEQVAEEGRPHWGEEGWGSRLKTYRLSGF